MGEGSGLRRREGVARLELSLWRGVRPDLNCSTADFLFPNMFAIILTLGSTRKIWGVTMAISYRISPGIGIARVGNSSDKFFIGPEIPDIAPDVGGSYRDQQDFLKRQGARFRIYEMDSNANGTTSVVRELTANDADIVWSVHLVNSKAAGPEFPPENRRQRNRNIADRSSLTIDAGHHSISGSSQNGQDLVGSFRGIPVKLGNLQTDSDGRLIVLGGHGLARSVPTSPIKGIFNNDNWHDDVSDGPVRAQIFFQDAEPIEAEPAWIVVTPPAYAPEIDNMMTWYDQARSVTAQTFRPLIMDEKPSFTRDIFPVLKRTVLLQWTSKKARSGHRTGRGNFLRASALKTLSDNSNNSKRAREDVFERLVEPGTSAIRNSRPSGRQSMPFLYSGVDPNSPERYTRASLTDLQYEQFRQWVDGNFEADWNPSSTAHQALDDFTIQEQPSVLDRAALQACIGGPFFPGIEAGYQLALPSTYEAPYRVDRQANPGMLTQGLALPWHTDFEACGRLWWPAQRPVSVSRQGQWEDYVPSNWNMIENWWKLGFVLRDGKKYIEQERLN